MTWIFGALKRSGKGDLHPYSRFHATPAAHFLQPDLYVATGGIDETCHCSFPSTTHPYGWVVVGCGIELKRSRAQILGGGGADWGDILGGWSASVQSQILSLDGHFAVVRWDQEGLTLACDQLGLRTFYVAESGGNILFSTRLDWLARAAQKSTIDFKTLGSRWLLYNQLSYRSGIAGIDRLGPAGLMHIPFAPASVSTTWSTPWLPEFGDGDAGHAISIAESLVECACALPQGVSLGLSGGLDSRLLLSMMKREDSRNVNVHTFGDPEDPDVAVATTIAGDEGLHQRLFQDPLPDGGSILTSAREYAAQTQLTEPVSSSARLSYYARLREAGLAMIDGGFGEIARRQYLNRIALLGRSALRRGDVNALLRRMSVSRADVFASDVVLQMEEGARSDLRAALAMMPSLKDVGIDNYLDLLAVRTRVPNWGGPEQCRLDGEVLNFMPLAQPSFLRAVFASRVRARQNGKWCLDYIASHTKTLTRWPLVKSGATYPFGLPTLGAHGLVALKGRMGRRYHDAAPHMFLHRIREYVQDRAASSSVKSSGIYNADFIRRAVEGYYIGREDFRDTVNWWVTFDLWRESLSGSENAQRSAQQACAGM